MPDPTPRTDHFAYVAALCRTARRHAGLWLVPLAAATLVALLTAIFGPERWEASQAFLVGEELIGRVVAPGRFESLDTMKTAQETISELARRPAVLRRALLATGPAEKVADPDWPSEEDIAGLRDAVTFSAPGGAEFGKTEVLIMHVRGRSRERARQLTEALFAELQKEVRSVRQLRAASMVSEMKEAHQLATGETEAAARKLAGFEARVGADLAELRTLNEPTGGTGDLRKMYTEIRAELRAARTRLETGELLGKELAAIRQDPSRLVVTPRELIESQPALSHLKQKLIEAQVAQATVGGNYSDRHPRFQAARNAVADIEREVFDELDYAIAGVEVQQSLTREQVALLEEQANRIDARLNELAAMRVDYDRLVSELNQCRTKLATTREGLIQAEAIHQAAASVDFMEPIDPAQAGLYPLGPSRKIMVLTGMAVGLFLGLGLVMIATPVPRGASCAGPAEVAQPPVRQPRPANPLAGTSITTVGIPDPGFSIPDIRHVTPPSWTG